MIKQIHVYDLDGVLADSTHRFRVGIDGKIDLAYWRENSTPEKIGKDKPLPLSKQYRKQKLDKSCYLVIATARVMEYPDFLWIEKHLGYPNKIIHRKTADNKEKGATLKIKGCKFLRNLKQFSNAVIHFWEDNPDYLYPFCEALNAVPHYVPSSQGI